MVCRFLRSSRFSSWNSHIFLTLLFWCSQGKAGSGINTLLVAEDTDYHQNDYLWSYDLDSGEMTRLLTSVYGAEVTGAAYYEDGDGCSIFTAVIQHPYGETDQERFNDTESTGKEGYVGYIGPIGNKGDVTSVGKSP